DGVIARRELGGREDAGAVGHHFARQVGRRVGDQYGGVRDRGARAVFDRPRDRAAGAFPSPVVAATNTSARAAIDRFERNLVIISTCLLCVWKVPLLIAALAQRTSEGCFCRSIPAKRCNRIVPRWRRSPDFFLK